MSKLEIYDTSAAVTGLDPYYPEAYGADWMVMVLGNSSSLGRNCFTYMYYHSGYLNSCCHEVGYES